MSDTCVFSIIVPIYNSECYLKKCIDSVLQQTFLDFELILVDDGSTDNSGQIARQYEIQDKRVRYVYQANGGHTAARNKGLSIATGDYIVFVDSDDWVEPKLLEDCNQVIMEQAPDIVLYGYQRVEGDKITKKKSPFKTGFYNQERIEDEILPSLLTSGRFSLSERIMKRELTIRNQKLVDPMILLGEDLICCVCAMAEAKSVYVLEGVYYNYLQHSNSVVHSSKNYTFENWERLKSILDRQLDGKIPNYLDQLGICSIRFLDRAVMGTIENKGLGITNRKEIKKHVKKWMINISNLELQKQKKAIRYKYKCLQKEYIYLLYFGNITITTLRRMRRII